MHHTSAYFRSVDSSAGLTQIFALPGSADNPQSGNHVFWEDRLIVGVYVGSVLWARSQLVIPSTRALGPLEVWPGNQGAEPLSPLPLLDLRNSPHPVKHNEQISLLSQDTTAGAVAQWGVLHTVRAINYGIPRGPVVSIRGTGTTTLVANAWTNVPLTLTDALAPGEYAVIGMRAQSAGCIAARLVLVGQYERPGCAGADAVSDLPHEMFQPGGLGVWGRFTQSTVPSVEFLSISADTSEVVDLACVKVA